MDNHYRPMKKFTTLNDQEGAPATDHTIMNPQPERTLAEIKDEVAKKIADLTWDELSYKTRSEEVEEVAELYASQFKQRGEEWVSVEGRLPEEYERCAIFKLDVALICYGIAIFTQGKFLFDATFLTENEKLFDAASDKTLKGVTHWLPLPKSPQRHYEIF